MHASSQLGYAAMGPDNAVLLADTQAQQIAFKRYANQNDARKRLEAAGLACIDTIGYASKPQCCDRAKSLSCWRPAMKNWCILLCSGLRIQHDAIIPL